MDPRCSQGSSGQLWLPQGRAWEMLLVGQEGMWGLGVGPGSAPAPPTMGPASL